MVNTIFNNTSSNTTDMPSNKNSKGKGKKKDALSKNKSSGKRSYIENQPSLLPESKNNHSSDLYIKTRSHTTSASASANASANASTATSTMVDTSTSKINNSNGNCNLAFDSSVNYGIKEVKKEISKLKRIVDEQYNKIKKLERSTRELTEREDMLEEAVNDLYDIHEETYSSGDNVITTADGVVFEIGNNIDEEDFARLYKTNGIEDLTKIFADMTSVNIGDYSDGDSDSKDPEFKPNIYDDDDYLDDDDDDDYLDDDDDDDYLDDDDDDDYLDDDDDDDNYGSLDSDSDRKDKLIVEMTNKEYEASADDMAIEEAVKFLNTPTTRSTRLGAKVNNNTNTDSDSDNKGKKRNAKITSMDKDKSRRKDKDKDKSIDGPSSSAGKRVKTSTSYGNMAISGGSKSLPPSLLAMLRKSIQKTDPHKYVADICNEKNISKKKRKELQAHVKEFIELNKKADEAAGNNEDDQSTELDHFISTDSTARNTIIKNMRELVDNGSMKKPLPYKFKIISSNMDAYTKQIALYKATQLENIQPGIGEYYKLKTWLDTLLDIPWSKYHNLDVPKPEIAKYLCNARQTMDKVIYGQNETKDIIVQIISKMLSNPSKCGNVFAIYGPPGVGKTTIIKEGMSKALGVPFSFVSLGGATDSSYLDGHGYTYEGSTPGKIVEIIKKVGCLNPIIYFDELDKISSTRKGEEVANLLVHLTDCSQNTLFHDKYLGNIPIDLSKVVYVFSFNDITKVNPILLDRMELIYVKGFTDEEKMVITKNYLIPEIMRSYNLDTGLGDNTHQPFVTFSEDNIKYIIKYGENNAEPHSQIQELLAMQGLSSGSVSHGKDEGVRQIKRRIEKICGQLNIVKLTGGCWNDPIHSTLDNIDELRQTGSDGALHLTNETIEKLLKIKSTQVINSGPPSGMFS